MIPGSWIDDGLKLSVIVLLANEVRGYINNGINFTFNTVVRFNSFISKISDLTVKCKRAAYDAEYKLSVVELAE